MSSAPPHLLGQLHRAWRKATYAQRRMHLGRLHRPELYVHKPTGRRIAICRNKWGTAHSRWQKRFSAAARRLDAYNIWTTVPQLDP